jgi:hypothetical protein
MCTFVPAREQNRILLCQGSPLLPRRRRRKPLHMRSDSDSHVSAAINTPIDGLFLINNNPHSSANSRSRRRHLWTSNGRERPNSCEPSVYQSQPTPTKRDSMRSHSRQTFLCTPRRAQSTRLFLSKYTNEDVVCIARPRTSTSRRLSLALEGLPNPLNSPTPTKQLNRVCSIPPLDLGSIRSYSVREPIHGEQPSSGIGLLSPTPTKQLNRVRSIRPLGPEPTRSSSVPEPTPTKQLNRVRSIRPLSSVPEPIHEAQPSTGVGLLSLTPTKQLNRVRSIRPLSSVPEPIHEAQPSTGIGLLSPTPTKQLNRVRSIRPLGPEPTRSSFVSEPTRSGVDSLPVLHSIGNFPPANATDSKATEPNLPATEPNLSATGSNAHLKAVAFALIAASRGSASASVEMMAWEHNERLKIKARRHGSG